MSNGKVDRRAFLGAASAALVTAGTTKRFAQAPAIVGSDSLRPSTAFGATAGDVDVDRGNVVPPHRDPGGAAPAREDRSVLAEQITICQ